MISNQTIHGIENTFDSGGGLVWNRLHSEREQICEAIAHTVATTPAHLQFRLRRIDDALDRLFSGSYGHCSKCGKQIEELSTDPTIAFCTECSNAAPS